MGLSFSTVPGPSSIRDTVTSAQAGLRDFGSAAIGRTAALGAAGLDLGRRAVDAAASFDVREAAATVRGSIASATEAARDGIGTGTEWAGQRTHRAADFARSHVTSDDLASRALRGAITAGETSTRFQFGVVAGVWREIVGLAGTVGQFATTVVEWLPGGFLPSGANEAVVGGAGALAGQFSFRVVE